MSEIGRIAKVRFRLSWRTHGREPWHGVGHGYLMPLFRILLWLATLPSTLLFGPRQEYAYVPGHRKDAWTSRRAKFIDAYVILWSAFEITVYFELGPSALWRFAVWLVAWHMVDLMGSVLRIMLFDRTLGRTGEVEIKVGNQARNIVLLLVNYVELIFGFAVLYSSNGLLETAAGAADKWTALYFSGVTQLTIGFGDVLPLNEGRMLAVVQSLCGVVFLGLLLTTFLSGFAKISVHRVRSRRGHHE